MTKYYLVQCLPNLAYYLACHIIFSVLETYLVNSAFTMVGCSIYGCKSRSEKQDRVTFHAFPKDAFCKLLWIQATGRSNWTPTIFSKVCSKHFEENAIVCRKKIFRILPTALPTKHLPRKQKKTVPLPKVKDHPKTPKRPSRAKRALMLKRRKMIAIKQYKKDMEQRCKQAHEVSDKADSNDVSSNTVWDTPGNSGQTRMLQITPQLYQKLSKRQSAGVPGFKFKVVNASQESVVPSDKDIDDDDINPEIPDIEPENVFMYPGIKDVRSLNRNKKSEGDVTIFENYLCSECNEAISGFRYTCVQCSDLDLCGACEADRAHYHHYVLRIPGERPASEVQFVLATIRHHLMKKMDPINESAKEQDDVMSKTSERNMEFESDDDFVRNVEDANYTESTDDEETDDADLDDIDSEERGTGKILKGSKSEINGVKTVASGSARTTRGTAAKTNACSEASTVLNTENSEDSTDTRWSTEELIPISAVALGSKARPAPSSAVNSTVNNSPSIGLSSGTSAVKKIASNTEAKTVAKIETNASVPVKTGGNTRVIEASSTVMETVVNTRKCIETSNAARTVMSNSVSNARAVSNIGTCTRAKIAASSSANTITTTGSSPTMSSTANNRASNGDTPATGASTGIGVNTGAKSGVFTAKGALTAVIKSGTCFGASAKASNHTSDTKETVTTTGTGIGASSAASTVAKSKILIKRTDIINMKDFKSPVKLICVSPLSKNGMSLNYVKTLPLPPYGKQQLQNPDTG